MAAFEVIDLGAVAKDLSVELDWGPNILQDEGQERLATTDIYVRPPLSPVEFEEVVGSVEAESALGILLVASGVTDLWQQFSVEGEPSEEHTKLGIELAQQIISVRGLRAGIVKSVAGEKIKSYLVNATSVEDTAEQA